MSADPTTLPPRIPEPVVRELAGGYSHSTLKKRIAAGRMPRHVDRGRYLIYDRDQVLRALNLTPSLPPPADPWDFKPGAVNDRLSRPLRGAQAPR